MPKKRKNTRAGDGRRVRDVGGSEEDSVSDSASITSGLSDVKSICKEGTGEVEAEDGFEQEQFEEKLKEAIDGATQKSAKGRQTCLEYIVKAFTSRHIHDFISERRVTLTDCIERSLRKGKGEEQCAAAFLAIMLCIQLGAGDESDEVFKELKDTLLVVASDVSVPPKARSKCYTALGLCTFIAGGEQEAVDVVVSSLESAFCASYLKGNGVVPNHAADLTALHSSALVAWALMLTVMPRSQLLAKVDSHLYRLPELLESPDVELRITAGETIALFYEILREFDDNFQGDDIDELCDKLKQLATDSHKYRAKKDRKQQRTSFRDILKAVEENDAPNIQLKFGREVLELDSWCRKRQYDAFCQVLGSGMNFHLSENDLLREIFELGAPISANGAGFLKVSKFERHMNNVATFKARTLARSKFRDKRAIIM